MINGGNAGGFVLGLPQFEVGANAMDKATSNALYNFNNNSRTSGIKGQTKDLLDSLLNANTGKSIVFDNQGNVKKNISFNYDDRKSIDKINSTIGTGESSTQGGNGSSVADVQKEIKNEIDKNTEVTKGNETVSNNTSIADTGKTDRPTVNDGQNFPLEYSYTGGKKPSVSLENLVNIANKSEQASSNTSLVSEFQNMILGKSDSVVALVARIGRYIIYLALIIFGVKCMFEGADGKAKFKEVLPYILIALILFFAAPGIVELAKNSFSLKDPKNFGTNIFNTVIYILRILAFAGLVFAGVKYIFASAEERAGVKSNLVYIIIGCALVFAAAFIVDMVVTTANDAGIESDVEYIKDK